MKSKLIILESTSSDHVSISLWQVDVHEYWSIESNEHIYESLTN